MVTKVSKKEPESESSKEPGKGPEQEQSRDPQAKTEEPLERKLLPEHVKYFFIFITVVTTTSLLYLLRNDLFALTELSYKLIIGMQGVVMVWLIKQAKIPLRIKLMKILQLTPFVSIVSSPGAIKFIIADTRVGAAVDGGHQYTYNDRPMHKRELFGVPANIFVEGKSKPIDMSVDGQEAGYPTQQNLVRIIQSIPCPNPECDSHNGFDYELDVPVVVATDNPDSDLVRTVSLLAERKGFEKAKLKMTEDDNTKKITLGLTFIILMGIGLILYLQMDTSDTVGLVAQMLNENTRASAELSAALVQNSGGLNLTVTPGRVERLS